MTEPITWSKSYNEEMLAFLDFLDKFSSGLGYCPKGLAVERLDYGGNYFSVSQEICIRDHQGKLVAIVEDNCRVCGLFEHLGITTIKKLSEDKEDFAGKLFGEIEQKALELKVREAELQEVKEIPAPENEPSAQLALRNGMEAHNFSSLILKNYVPNESLRPERIAPLPGKVDKRKFVIDNFHFRDKKDGQLVARGEITVIYEPKFFERNEPKDIRSFGWLIYYPNCPKELADNFGKEILAEKGTLITNQGIEHPCHFYLKKMVEVPISRFKEYYETRSDGCGSLRVD